MDQNFDQQMSLSKSKSWLTFFKACCSVVFSIQPFADAISSKRDGYNPAAALEQPQTSMKDRLRTVLYCVRSGLYYKHIMIVNDPPRVVISDATFWSITLQSSITIGLATMACTVTIYDHNDSTIVINDCNDSDQHYKTMILANLALAGSINYDRKIGCKLNVPYNCNYIPYNHNL